ncbi:adenosine kinase isoform X1 [Strongylocentrotus purpuratus]|uniref:Adenosine kinase n=1 Tax=Strongylocentrotus purpuratus TaxID=7668 RepID=A0A7M7NF27_STRPU|nr:adenosine kinase isoform X1 [Strongylocentrotus purpuratus]
MAANDNGEPDTKKSRVTVGEGALCGIGNPLLDISANADAEILAKYDLKPNDAILSEEKHLPLFKELADKYEVEYIPGGATQNTFRVAQWILDQPKVSTFFGCIGDDEYGKELANGMEKAGCVARYLVDKEVGTGTCACIITSGGKNRSLAANLSAANCFKASHFDDKENWDLVKKSKVMYSAGFHLTVAPDAMLLMAKHANEENKIYCTNLSAPFLCDFFSEPQMKLMPYVDYLFGNETEAASFSKKQNFGTEDLQEIALKAAALPKENKNRERVVVFTQGDKPTIVVKGGKVTVYEVNLIKEEEIVDTNGAGDAFVGGFLAQLVQGKDIASCVECGHFAARYIIQRSGTTMENKANYK